jgi:hypothetical protein
LRFLADATYIVSSNGVGKTMLAQNLATRPATELPRSVLGLRPLRHDEPIDLESHASQRRYSSPPMCSRSSAPKPIMVARVTKRHFYFRRILPLPAHLV